MWETRNLTPFSAEGYLIRDRNGAEYWVSAVRATFDYANGQFPKLAEVQSPVLLAPVYADDASEELLSDTDIAPFKPICDFIVRGAACLPDMTPFAELEASVALDQGWQKAGFVSASRLLRKVKGDYTLERGDRHDKVKLSWRHALGGADLLPPADQAADSLAENPIGLGWTRRWADLPDGAEIRMPLIEASRQRIQLGRDLPQSFGFGAVQPNWRPRTDHVGTYDDAWRKTRAPLLPGDFDDRFYQSAPQDQHLPLKGGERVQAINLSPDGPIDFRIPQVILETSTQIGRDKVEGRMRLIAVELDTEAGTLAMVWNGLAPCTGRDTEVDRSTVKVRQISGAVL